MKFYVALLVGSVVCLVVEASATPAQFKPAVQRTDEYSLARQISFPQDYKEGQDFSLSIACTVRVGRQGRMRLPFCLGGSEETKNFEKRILLATQRARLFPARVNGKRKPVSFQFTAIFRRVNGAASVTVVPNHYLNVSEFGAIYTAPQLLIWDTKYYPRVCFRMNIMMKITVDASGAASNARFYLGDRKANSCIRALQKNISRFKYLPGTVKGVPTTMDHLFLVGWRGGWTMSGGTL